MDYHSSTISFFFDIIDPVERNSTGQQQLRCCQSCPTEKGDEKIKGSPPNLNLILMGNRDKNKIDFYKLQSGSVSQLIKYENLDMSLLIGHFLSCFQGHLMLYEVEFLHLCLLLQSVHH